MKLHVHNGEKNKEGSKKKTENRNIFSGKSCVATPMAVVKKEMGSTMSQENSQYLQQNGVKNI
jgi:hypothetical protein